jgi:uncharacterized protein (DUF952 family)
LRAVYRCFYFVIAGSAATKQSLRHFISADNCEFFPHIYGPLNTDAVTAVLDFTENENGFVLPQLPTVQ